MVNEAPRHDRENDAGTEGAGQEHPAGPPEGFQPPAEAGAEPGAGAWPTLGLGSSAGHAQAGGYGSPGGDPIPASHGYETGPGAGADEGPPPGPRRLYRSETDRVIAGVCGGLRDYLGVDANLLRVVFVLLAVFAGGSGLLIYVILWALVPRRSRLGLSPTETVMDAVNEVRDRFQGLRRA